MVLWYSDCLYINNHDFMQKKEDISCTYMCYKFIYMQRNWLYLLHLTFYSKYLVSLFCTHCITLRSCTPIIYWFHFTQENILTSTTQMRLPYSCQLVSIKCHHHNSLNSAKWMMIYHWKKYIWTKWCWRILVKSMISHFNRFPLKNKYGGRLAYLMFMRVF